MKNIKDTATFHFKAYSYFSSYPLKQPIFCTSLTKRSLKPLTNFCTNKIDRGVDQNKDQRLGNPFYKFLIETMRHEALQLWAECHVCMQKKAMFYSQNFTVTSAQVWYFYPRLWPPFSKHPLYRTIIRAFTVQCDTLNNQSTKQAIFLYFSASQKIESNNVYVTENFC